MTNGQSMSKVTVDRRLWLTTDGSLVEDGDPDAAFLWAPAGREVAAEVAAEVGYQPASVDSPDVDDTVEDEPEPEPEPEHQCDVCGFVAKSAGGLGAHQRSHE